MKETILDRGAIQRLLEMIGGDRGDLLELVEEFHRSTPLLLSQMEAAAASRDLNALRIASHGLKSNGRDFGAVSLAALCERLERDCKSGTVADPSAEVTAISRELTVAREALDKVIAENE